MSADMNKATQVYNTLCASIDHRNWHYQRHDDKLVVTFRVSGEDIPMEFIILVDADRQLVRLLSRLPFKMAEDKRLDGAIATCAATNQLANGCFDYDISDGTIMFRLTASYRESMIGEGLFSYMINCSAATVDEYNDKFLAISTGTLSISDFLEKL